MSPKLGRPAQELTPARRRELERLAGRVARRRAELGELEAELAQSIVAAAGEGASVRRIADAASVSVGRVHKVLAGQREEA